MVTSLTGFINSVMKSKIETILTIASALVVLFTTMMDPCISASITVALLVALGIYICRKIRRREGISKWITDLEGG